VIRVRYYRVLVLGAVVAVLAALGLAAASPDERTMGAYVRILYVHAGGAWTAYLAYALAAVGAAMYLGRRGRRWDRLALASAEWGLVLTTITLVTGSLFGKSTSNWWWNWSDVRLVVTLLLWFLYAAYLVLRQFVPGEGGRVVSAVLALVGIPVMVLNHFAVTFWQRSHPGAVMVRVGGPSADDAIVLPLAVASLAYLLVFVVVLVLRINLEALRDGEQTAYQP
jgi:heme exporter protein C